MKQQWPKLSFELAKETYQTLHLWTQIVGKIKLSKMPWTNHSWHVALYVTPKGLSTMDIPDQEKHFQIEFDFIDHLLQINTSDGEYISFELGGVSVAGFYKKVIEALRTFNIYTKINEVPNELEDPTPFPDDELHATYDPKQASDLHKALFLASEVFGKFRAGFKGKCSPVHFFWGSFDLTVSRFSGNDAPKHPGGIPNLPDWVAQEAYSQEVCSCGFWPGNEVFPIAAFYSYIYPEPEAYKDSDVKPSQAYYHQELNEFILPYEQVQNANDPSATLMEFLRSTYEKAADLANWDRDKLEQSISKFSIANYFNGQ